MTFEAILNEALALSEDERAALAKRLVATLGAQDMAESDEAWTGEIRRRLEDISSGRVETVQSDVVMARLRSKWNVSAY